MKFRFLSIIIVIFAVMQVALVSFAGTITGPDVEKFIKTMETLNQMEGSGQFSDIDDMSMDGLSGLIDNDGNFAVFKRSEKKLRAHPAEYSQLRKATNKGGFSTPSEWAKVGDNVMMVYMRSEMGNDMGRMDDIPPEMLAMMPPAVQAQMASAMKMVKAVENVSKADVKTLKPYKKRLEKALK